MTTREVVLDGGSPWGFRLHGGADLNQPLRISRVNPGSKAALRGIREGDFITSINNQSTKDLSNAEAHTLLRNSGDTLKLGLNENNIASPKRRQYKTVHQETHSETVKKSSITSYTVTSKTFSQVTSNNSNDEKTSNVHENITNINGDQLDQTQKTSTSSPRSTLSSNYSSASSTYTNTSLTSPSGKSNYTNPSGLSSGMADNGRSRRKRSRNNRRKSKKNINTEVIIEESADYSVESPKRVKSPEIKKPIKSRSLDDDDDLVKIQELSEISESEDKSECKAIVSEAESDVEWEKATSIQDAEVDKATAKTFSLELEECTTEEVSLMSPEEELNLRNFLEGLNLVNSPDDAFKQVREVSTVESIKSRRARKRAELEQYFTPLVQNPRFLEVINEETSDLSDREQSSLTHHLKQGTPEPEIPRLKPRKRKTIENPTILVGTKIIEVPKMTHEISSANVPQCSTSAEVVYLEDSSNSTTPDPKSDDEDKETNDDLLSSTNSSVPDFRESEVIENKLAQVETKATSEINDKKEVFVSELTPPPTPDISPKNEEIAQSRQTIIQIKTEDLSSVNRNKTTSENRQLNQNDAKTEKLENSKENIIEVGLENNRFSEVDTNKDKQELHQRYPENFEKLTCKDVNLENSSSKITGIVSDCQNVNKMFLTETGSGTLKEQKNIIESSNKNLFESQKSNLKNSIDFDQVLKERIIPIEVEDKMIRESNNLSESQKSKEQSYKVGEIFTEVEKNCFISLPTIASPKEIIIKVEREEANDNQNTEENIENSIKPVTVETNVKSYQATNIFEEILNRLWKPKENIIKVVPEWEEKTTNNTTSKIVNSESFISEKEHFCDKQTELKSPKETKVEQTQKEDSKKPEILKLKEKIIPIEIEKKNGNSQTYSQSVSTDFNICSSEKIENKIESKSLFCLNKDYKYSTEKPSKENIIEIKVEKNDFLQKNLKEKSKNDFFHDLFNNFYKDKPIGLNSFQEKNIEKTAEKEHLAKSTDSGYKNYFNSIFSKESSKSEILKEETKSFTGTIIKNNLVQINSPKEKNIEIQKENKDSFAYSKQPKETIKQVKVEEKDNKKEPENKNERIIKIEIEKSKEIQSENAPTNQTSKERIINVEIEDSKAKNEKFKQVKVIRTKDLKSSPDIMKLDDVKPPLVFPTVNITPNQNDEKDLIDQDKKSEAPTIDFSKVYKPKEIESPSKEVSFLCEYTQHPESTFYSNVLSPPAPTPSPSLSSGSSRATSLCTAKYNPMSSSIADITSISDELKSPPTLRELCLKFLISQPFGTDVLQELADVASNIQHLTNRLLSTVDSAIPAFMDRPTSWIGLPTDFNPNLLLCLSPTQKCQLEKTKKITDEASKLLDLHAKFISRTTNHDAVEKQVKNAVEITAIQAEPQEMDQRKFSSLPRNMDSARLKAKDLSEWLRLAREQQNENSQTNAQNLYQQQLQYLREKEREIQMELEMLEEEKRRLLDAEMAPRRFKEEDYNISKRGDFAESKKSRPLSMPTEFFRQQMYEEYMDKFQEREERKQHKVIKVSHVETSQNTKTPKGIEDEFMSKVKEKQKLGKLNLNESDCESTEEKLPKHLQEFMDMAKIESENNSGVWSPGQKQESKVEETPKTETKDEPISPIWTPKSATSSPVVERKEFRPVKFESPILSRKNTNSQDSSVKDCPWKVPETSSDTGVSLSSTLEKRLPTSHSSPASGFNDFSTPRLPKAQNPTITLLQKAREGQIPKGAIYIEQEQPMKKPQNEKPAFVGPGEILYQIKNEYTSESDSEKPRKMADLGPRKFEGIGPTTRDGMPLILRSEVKDSNQSKWYKKMYDTIHKQKPHKDEFVTVRYRQKRGQYPYTSGYLSEPEPGAYDSDFTDYKYATLDRRRWGKEKESEFGTSTMPRPGTDKVGSSVVKHGHDPYKNQPGRIENYIPGHSSISEKEAKEWWDEVMDIFDGHLEQQKRVPQTKSFMNQALKESGYESDSTLVFRRRDDAVPQLSPSEQKEAYKIVQKGGDIPLHGFRKPAPERPKEEPELEYFPISPTLTRIRIHKNIIKPPKEILCYPVTVHPHPSTVFARYKRTAPSAVNVNPKPQPTPPSPPKRRSSRNNSTLRLISTMKVKSEKSPICKRHETCFTTTSNIDNTKVKYLRDKITYKLSPPKGKDTKPKIKVSKTFSTSPEVKSKLVSTVSASKDSKLSKIQSRTSVVKSSQCCSGRSVRKSCKKCSIKTEVPQTRTFGSEKRKVDLVLPKSKTEKRTLLVSSPELRSPTEVKKAVETQSRALPPGTVYKKSTALLASARNGLTTDLKNSVIPIQVGISEKGKEILKSTTQKPSSSILRTKSLSPLSSKQKISLDALKSQDNLKKSTRTSTVPLTKASKIAKPKTLAGSDLKKSKNAKKEELIKKDPSKDLTLTKCAGRAAGTEIVKKLRQMKDSADFGSNDTLEDIKKQKEAIQTDYFFQHLFLRDLPSPALSSTSKNSWLLERTYLLQKRKPSTSEPTIGAMKLYLRHTKPVTDSKFITMDLALARSRSASPKTVRWDSSPVRQVEKRSSSLPPKLVFSQTSRPVSPKVERKKSPTPPSSPRLMRSPSSRKIMQMRSHPIEKIYESCESPKPTNALSIYSCPSISRSTSSIDSYDRKEYQNYVKELLRSSPKSSKFKDLNEFYNAIEKFGQLEQTTSSHHLKPRRRFEDEIIDYDRWQEVRTRERAEKELEALVKQLKKDAREKGFLFSPKEIDAYRWKKDCDRGLRIKEKSVDNIKEEFEKLKREESERENIKRRELAALKDTYKPLWRGDSVLSLANKIIERRSQSEGRVSSVRQKLIDNEKMLTHGIGSRLWSSLSSEQVNILKNQLSQIYNQSFQKKEQDFSIQVPEEKTYRSPLTVRRNSDTSSLQKTPERSLTENEKKMLSQTISKEVLDHMNKRKNEAVPPLVLAKETRGAIAAAMSKSCPSDLLNGIEKEEPIQALVKTDATIQKLPSASETESGSTDDSTKTVIHIKKDEIKKKVEYFENVAEHEKYSPVIYKPAESHYDIGETSSIQSKSPTESQTSFVRHSSLSQSYQNLKEFFGEKEIMKFATIPLSATRKEAYVSPERPQLRVSTMRVPSPPISETTSYDSFNRSRSLSPYNDESLALVKTGEVRRLKNKFEYAETPKLRLSKPRRCKSDSNLYKYKQIWIPGQNSNDFEALRWKYEYPVHVGRGRSRFRRGGVVSPTFLRAEDRFMPHINIISKIANLYTKKQTHEEKTQSMEELAKILGCPIGEVEKLRKKFEEYGHNISLLGHMFTSSPNIKELRDIAPYLAASWIAHRYPKFEDNTRSLSSPESSIASRDTSLVRRDRLRPKSTSPISKKSSILKVQKQDEKKIDAKMQPVNRYQPEPQRYKSWWSSTYTRPSVSFQGVVFKPRASGTTSKRTPRSKESTARKTAEQLARQQETTLYRHTIANLPLVYGPIPYKSPRKYVENEVTIHYKTPVRQEIKEYLSEDELAHRQAEAMKKIYQEERRRKYLQVSKSLQELQDMNNRRHTDNFIPSQKSPIPLNRYDDFDDLTPPVKPRPKSPEPRLMARALYNFVGQTARELTFRKGDLIYVRRQVDKNWYEGELNAMVGLFPVNYVEIVTCDSSKATPRKSHEGQARAKYNFVAQTHLELSLAKGELVVITRRVDDNWFEGRIGGRKGIFPVSYVDVLIDPNDPPPPSTKPVASPAAHSLLLNGTASGKESMGSHSYTPHLSTPQLTSSYHAKPVQVTGSYGSLNRGNKNPVNQALHIETQSEPIPYRALYKYLPQNDDELELLEGDTVYVLEKCDDGWYVGSSERTGAFGTFPGNYVEKI